MYEIFTPLPLPECQKHIKTIVFNVISGFSPTLIINVNGQVIQNIFGYIYNVVRLTSGSRNGSLVNRGPLHRVSVRLEEGLWNMFHKVWPKSPYSYHMYSESFFQAITLIIILQYISEYRAGNGGGSILKVLPLGTHHKQTWRSCSTSELAIGPRAIKTRTAAYVFLFTS